MGPGSKLAAPEPRARDSVREKEKRTEWTKVVVGIPTRSRCVCQKMGYHPAIRPAMRAKTRSFVSLTILRRSGMGEGSARWPAGFRYRKEDKGSEKTSRFASMRAGRHFLVPQIPDLRHFAGARSRRVQERQNGPVVISSEGSFFIRRPGERYKL